MTTTPIEDALRTKPIGEVVYKLKAIVELGAHFDTDAIKTFLEMPVDELRQRLALVREAGRVIAGVSGSIH